MYKVIKFFTDLQDHNRPYHVGDEFPRAGMKVSDARLNELAGSKNKQGAPLIEKIPDVVGSGSETPAQPPKTVEQGTPPKKTTKGRPRKKVE